MIRYTIVVLGIFSLSWLANDHPIEHCNADYCIYEGQTLEQIGVNYYE